MTEITPKPSENKAPVKTTNIPRADADLCDININSSVSAKVGDKNVLKTQINKALNAIINLLKANYPDTYKSELRNWGFQKEKY